MKIFHYTKEVHLENILKDGVVNIEENRGYKVPCFVWLTSELYVPNTARPIDINTSAYVDMEFYRFIFDTSDVRILPWKVAKKRINGSREKAQMDTNAKAQGDNPKKWFVSFDALEIGNYEPATLSPNAPKYRAS